MGKFRKKTTERSKNDIPSHHFGFHDVIIIIVK